jgi:hypothetical protein
MEIWGNDGPGGNPRGISGVMPKACHISTCHGAWRSPLALGFAMSTAIKTNAMCGMPQKKKIIYCLLSCGAEPFAG